MILAADDGAAERSLGRIVVERDARILDESREARPALEHVAHRFPEIAPRQPDLDRGPLPDANEDRTRSLLSQLLTQPLCRGIASKWPRHETFDRVELTTERADFCTCDRPLIATG